MRKNRRMAQRLNIPLRVQYQLLDGRKIRVENTAQDVSGTGYRLLLGSPLHKGQKLKTLLYFSSDKQPVTAISEVVWSKKVLKEGKTFYSVGLKHIEVLPKDKQRFVFLFCEMMVNYFVL